MTPPLVAIVDDDDSFRLALSRVVRAHGLEVSAYASGEDFLGALPGAAPACVFLDLNLPGLGGLEVLRQLARSGGAIPAVVMTGLDRIGLREQCLAAGAVGFLTKPIGAAELAKALDRMLRSTASRG